MIRVPTIAWLSRKVSSPRPEIGRFEFYGLIAAAMSLVAILLLGIVIAWATARDVAELTVEETSAVQPTVSAPAADPSATDTVLRPLPRPDRG